MADHLIVVYEQTGEMPEELEMPELSTVETHLWNKFLSLQRGRGYGISGPNPLSYSEILAWTQLTGETLEAWEVDLMKKIDEEYIRFTHQGDKDGSR